MNTADLDLEALAARRPVGAALPTTARWSLRAEAERAHLYLYDAIGWPGIEARAVVEELRALATRPLLVHLNSPGGDVFAGLAVYNALLSHGAPVEVRVEGLAASIASIIAMGGSSLRMAKASLLMIHEPHALVIGDAHDMRHMAGLLDKAAGVMADVYAKRGADREKIRGWMHAETWFTPQSAVEAGLIDAVDGEPVPAESLAAQQTFDLSGFRRMPKPEPAEAPPVPRERERARLIATSFARLGGFDMPAAA
jgi:ATP-dependent protease ClpP protease subunit